jgi:hypothetical protein
MLGFNIQEQFYVHLGDASIDHRGVPYSCNEDDYIHRSITITLESKIYLFNACCITASALTAPHMSTRESTAPHEEPLPLLFINHSRYSTADVPRPTRKQVSAHVQGTIRKKKKRDAKLRLQIRPFKQGLVQFSTKGRDVKKKPITSAKNPSKASSTLSDSGSLQRILAPRPPSQAQFVLSLRPIDHSTSLASMMNSTTRPRSMAAQIAMNFCECMLPSPIYISCEILERILMVSPKVLHSWIDRIFPIVSEAEEHKKWLIQRAATSPLLCLAIAASGAASFASPTSILEGKRVDAISPATARSFEVMAINSLRSSLDSDSDVEPSILFYTIMCLMVVAVLTFAFLSIDQH